MKAMILAAGEGTRLRPLTNKVPKALIRVKGIPLLEHTINYLVYYGVDEIIVNIHHHADQIKDFIRSKNNFNIRIEFSDESDKLLDTGGGLKKASWFFNTSDPFFLTTTDIITNHDLDKIYDYNMKSHALVTLALKSRQSTRELLLNEDYRLCGWKSNVTGQKRLVKDDEDIRYSIAFSGYQVVNPAIFDKITEQDAFTLIDLYLRLTRDNLINGFIQNDAFWMEFGRIQNFKKAKRSLKLKRIMSRYSTKPSS
jgi:NDP-sugar pyrophosphorylase family protein